MKISECLKTFCTLKKRCRVRCTSLSVRSELLERVMVPKVKYGAKTWYIKERQCHKIDVKGTRCLRGKYRVTRMDRKRIGKIRRRSYVRKNE